MKDSTILSFVYYAIRVRFEGKH